MLKSFEKTYPADTFAGLVGLGMALAGLFAQAEVKNAAPQLPKGVTTAPH
jgi:hypothetical protein